MDGSKIMSKPITFRIYFTFIYLRCKDVFDHFAKIFALYLTQHFVNVKDDSHHYYSDRHC